MVMTGIGIRYRAVAFLVLGVLGNLAGCGGSGSSVKAGSFTMQIHWPANRAIPKLTESLAVEVSTSEGIIDKTIDRPINGASETSTSFDDLPLGVATVQCRAYGPPIGGVPPLLAIAVDSIDLQAGPDNTLVLDLVSTIDRIEVTAPGLTSGVLTIKPGHAVPLTVTAYSAATVIAPIGPGNVSFASMGSGFSISQNGNSATLKADSPFSGTNPAGTVTVTEAESGRKTTFSVVIQP